jgi:hypothetical protein
MPLPLVPLAIGAMGLGSAIIGGRNASRAQRAQQNALDFEKQKWAAGQGFRDKANSLLSREVDPEALTETFADPGNPYAAGNTFRPIMRPAQGASAPRTAQPRRAPRLDGVMGAPPVDGMGGDMGADMGDSDPMAAQRAQLAAFAEMMPQRQTARRMR